MASAVAGYFMGGTGSGGKTTTVDRFLFSNDSRTTLGTGLSATTYYNAGMASDAAGYSGGGGYSNVDTVDRFAFSDDSRTTLGTGLSTATYALAGVAAS
jgi:hypothetical protein